MLDKNEIDESSTKKDMWRDNEVEIPQVSLKNGPSYGTSRKEKLKNEPEDDDSVDEPPDDPEAGKSKTERTSDKDEDSVDEPPDDNGHQRAAPESDLAISHGGGTGINNSDLVVANIVDGSNMASLPFAQPAVQVQYDPDGKPKKIQRERKRKIRLVLTGLAGSLVVALIIVIAVVITKKTPDKNVPIASTDSVANGPTGAPTQARGGCIASNVAFISDPSTLDDPASPQSQALRWITNEDPLGLDCTGTAPFLLQRYALAVLYFSTTKDDSKWRDCGPTEEPTDIDCTAFQLLSDGEVPIRDRKYLEISNQKQWLKGTHECEWYGILCQDEGYVIEIKLGGNNLKGTIPEEIRIFEDTIAEIILSVNQLTGTIPSEVGLLSLLFGFEVAYNKLTGTIPEEIYGESSELESIVVVGNMISGTISTRIGQLNELFNFDVARNIFEGTIPTQIGNAASLEQLNLYENKLSGSIPTEIGKLTDMIIFEMSDNALNGTIPTEIGRLQALTELWLEFNSITGKIPDELYSLSSLLYLLIDINSLTGKVSPMIGQLKELQFLYIYSNELTGPIPIEIATMVHLEEIAIGLNSFTGVVPDEICGLNLEFFSADCLVNECNCCNNCCVVGSGCN